MGRRLGIAGQSILAGIAGVGFCILAACSSDDDVAAPGGSSGGLDGSIASDGSTSLPTDGGRNPSGDAAAEAGPSEAGPFTVVSATYADGAAIPNAQKCATDGMGTNTSPQLSWSGAPAGTASYAIVMRDTDFTPAGAPNGFRHWVIWDVPAATTSLAAGVPAGYEPATPAGAKQAIPQPGVAAGAHRYIGPCSSGQLNTYVITVYAIPTATIAGLGMASTAAEAEAAIVGAASASTKIAGEG